MFPSSTTATTGEPNDGTGATLTIHHRFCPQGYRGQDFYLDCHGNVGLVGIAFLASDMAHSFDGPEITWTGADGNARFADLHAGDYRISRDAYFDRFVVPLIFCADAANPGVEVYSTVDDPNWIDLHLDTGDNVICDWYTEFPSGWQVGRSSFPIIVYVCDRNPAEAHESQGEPPSGCQPAVGVRVEVKTLNGKLLGACTTGAGGGCRASTPYAIKILVEEDISTLPPNYEPVVNPITTWVYTEFAGAGFINLPSIPAGTPRAGSGT
jgi:hypothetical protein